MEIIGYKPRSGDSICILSRAEADVWQAISQEMPSARAWNQAHGPAEMVDEATIQQADAEMVTLLKKVWDVLRHINERNQHAAEVDQADVPDGIKQAIEDMASAR
jgi:hypothetical protein